MKISPLVSIIIPVYNVEKYLPECLDSVVNQTYKNLEIILVDDGSPDNCGKICDEYTVLDQRIKVIHKGNGGVSSARNIGIDAASGEWIYFLDSDDIIEKELIEHALNTALNDGTDMCFFDYENFNKDTKEKMHTLQSNKTIFKDTNNIETFIAYSSLMGSVCLFLVKYAAIKNKIEFDETINFSEDELFKFQIYGNINSFSYLHKVLYHYRQVSTSACGTMLKKKEYPDMMLTIYRKMLETIDNGNYPDNAAIVANTRLICRTNGVVRIAFQDRFSIKCDYKMISNFMNSNEYGKSRINYDKRTTAGHSNLFYASLKKPNRFAITLIFLLSKLREKLIKIKEV